MITTVLLIAVCLALFTGLITFIDKMRYIGRGAIDFFFVCRYVACLLPGIFVTYFPVAILIGGVIGLGNMARNSEIVVLHSIYSSEGRMSVTRSGIWLREGQSLIGIRSMLLDGSLLDIVRYETDGPRLVSKSRAESGKYENGSWLMQNVHTVLYGDELKISFNKTEKWQLNLNPERVDVINNIDKSLTLQGLIDYIGYLEENNQQSSAFRLQLYEKLMQPVIMIVMLFLALSTVFGPLRSMNMGARILAGITLGFGYYVLNQIVAPLSLVYGMPPLLGASLASIVFGMLAVYLLRRKV